MSRPELEQLDRVPPPAKRLDLDQCSGVSRGKVIPPTQREVDEYKGCRSLEERGMCLTRHAFTRMRILFNTRNPGSLNLPYQGIVGTVKLSWSRNGAGEVTIRREHVVKGESYCVQELNLKNGKGNTDAQALRLLEAEAEVALSANGVDVEQELKNALEPSQQRTSTA